MKYLCPQVAGITEWVLFDADLNEGQTASFLSRLNLFSWWWFLSPVSADLSCLTLWCQLCLALSLLYASLSPDWKAVFFFLWIVTLTSPFISAFWSFCLYDHHVTTADGCFVLVVDLIFILICCFQTSLEVCDLRSFHDTDLHSWGCTQLHCGHKHTIS